MPHRSAALEHGTPTAAVATSGLVPPSTPTVIISSPRARRSLRTFDRAISCLLVLPVLPVLAILWCLVRLTSRGPGIYSQLRAGLDGRPFAIYKLRTMTHNCEARTGAVWASKNDSRVTFIGRILRKTHLDELPQLFNVLKGDMALVGPRPERPEIVEMLVREIPNYAERMKVLPGVTGLAQIYAEPDQTLDDVRFKLSYDLRYITRASRWMDVRIVACTGLKMVGLNRGWVRRILFPSLHAKRREATPINVPGRPWLTP
jgi:lipopolysaccharide/colanic/teichoic acid biosynthesis glycosyltransferase